MHLPAEGLSAQFKTELALTGLQGDVLSGGWLGVVLLDRRRLEVGPRSGRHSPGGCRAARTRLR